LRPAVLNASANSHYRVDSRSNKCNVITLKLTGYEFRDDDKIRGAIRRADAAGSAKDSDQRQIIHSMQIVTNTASAVAGLEWISPSNFSGMAMCPGGHSRAIDRQLRRENRRIAG
jgi:hypothetical protein